MRYLIMFAVLGHDCAKIRDKQFSVQAVVRNADPFDFYKKFIKKNKCNSITVDNEFLAPPTKARQII